MKKLIVMALVAAGISFSSPAFAADDAAPVVVDAAPVVVDAAPVVVDAAPAVVEVNAAAVLEVPSIDSPEELPDFAQEAYKKVKSGSWSEFAAMFVILIVFALRNWGLGLLKFVKLDRMGKWLSSTDRGGVTLAVSVAVAGAIAHALYTHAHIDLELARSVLRVAVEAMGGFAGIKKLFKPVKEAAAA